MSGCYNLDKWKSSVLELNKTSENVDYQRGEIYSWLASKIKKLFEDNSIDAPKVHINPDGSSIILSWYDESEVILSCHMMMELDMEFSFTREVSNEGYWIKKIILYPFGKVED